MTMTSGGKSVASRMANEAQVFEQAKAYIKPSRMFRRVISIYAERKLVVILLVHFMMTMIVWTHYALVKWSMLERTLDEDSFAYWWKRATPPVLFGSKHAILLQLALIPITMSRYSIASLSDSFVDRFIPLNRAARIHMQLGYTMVLVTVLATLIFIAYFTAMCALGEQEYCDLLVSEILITGYAIAVLTILVAGTSYFRNHIQYEVFYLVHHLVFILYVLVVIHTIDGAQRSGKKQRCQTFQWVTVTLLYYVCDRVLMGTNHRYAARMVSFSTILGSNGCDTVILKLRRPILFDFKPGQYAFIRLKEIDHHWHPFSIASGPSSSFLEFYIEVFGDGSWTRKLFDALQGMEKEGNSKKIVDVEVMGPYGTSLGKTEDYSHAIVIGAGTGIVPLLSLFKQHVRKLVHCDSRAHFALLSKQEKKVMQVEHAAESIKGSFGSKMLSRCIGIANNRNRNQTRRDSVKESIVKSIEMYKEQIKSRIDTDAGDMQKAAFVATRSIYGVVVLALLPVIGVSLMGWTISLNTLDHGMYHGMCEFLIALTVIFQVSFVIVAFFIWDAAQLSAYLDAAVCMLTPFADWYWFRRYFADELLTAGEVASYCLFVGYLTARVWDSTVRPRHHSFRNIALKDGLSTLDKLHLIWSTRSACQCSQIFPEINKIWEGLVKIWGDEEKVKAVCQVSVYVTDKDKTAIESLQQRLGTMSLYKMGCVKFKRPDFHTIIEGHSLEMICTRRNSSTLLAFCGSPALGTVINEQKLSNDMVLAITGNKKHQMEYVSESYGGGASSRKKQITTGPANIKKGPMLRPSAGETGSTKSLKSDAASLHTIHNNLDGDVLEGERTGCGRLTSHNSLSPSSGCSAGSGSSENEGFQIEASKW